MAFKHQLQANRFELKYIIDEPRALAIRDYVQSYLVPDEFNPDGGGGYLVHSLYLDNKALDLCNATVYGHKNRFKLRIRFYRDRPDDPLFFEIKRRMNDAILKQRAVVRRSAVDRLLAGHWPEHGDMISYSPKGYLALRNFCDLRNSLQAGGRAIVSYMREAYVTADSDSVRVTFDREVCGAPFDGRLIVTGRHDWQFPQVAGTILELKFTDRFPNWMRQLVRTFGLMRISMPKYVECVHALGPFGGRVETLQRRVTK